MNEMWKDVVGYEGLYQVSNTGKVRSLDRYVPHKTLGKKFYKGRIMATHTTNSGYLCVNLSKNNKYTSFDIHRLVALAFLGIDDVSNLEVNHIDEDKKNNCVDNLEWVTKQQNNRHGTKVARQVEKVNRAVLQYDTEGHFIREWNSAVEAEKSISGKFTGAISHCVNGKSKSAYGFVWKLKEVT